MKLDIEEISKLDVSVKEYLILKYLYHLEMGGEELFVKHYGFAHQVELEMLERKAYIKKTNTGWQLRNKTMDLFQGKRELFYTFLSTFPQKTPSGRYLSVKGPETIAAEKLKKVWNKYFKNNDVAAKKAIRVLEAELEHRKKTNSLEYMHSAEVWLNQCDFEKYEFLLDEKDKIDQKTREDFQ